VWEEEFFGLSYFLTVRRECEVAAARRLFWYREIKGGKRRGKEGREEGTKDCRVREMTETIILRAVTLTHVRYRKGDDLGHALAWASLLPVFIGLGGFVTHFIFRRELQAFFFGLGLIVSEVINQVIKELVQEVRPATCEALEMCDSHGWPSSHSQYMCFFAVYATLLSVRRLQFADELRKVFTALLPWPFALTVMYSRVYLGYHTTSQVIAGGCLGLILGSLWYFFINVIVAPWFPALENTFLCRYLRIKDSSHIPDVIGFEYKNSRAARTDLDSQNEGKISKD
jgi:dolichyldiphosphatase